MCVTTCINPVILYSHTLGKAADNTESQTIFLDNTSYHDQTENRERVAEKVTGCLRELEAIK